MSTATKILILAIAFFNLGLRDYTGQKRKVDPIEKDVKHWYRGNTHAHARFSDKNGKDDIPEIAKWYKKSGYNFLVIAEHNDRLSKRKVICHDEAADPPKFIMLCGLELSENRHLTALGIKSFIDGENSLQDGVNKTIAAGGIPILNHPQEPVVKSTDFIKTKGLNHFEVFNGNNPQDTPASEKLWDSVLSAPDGRIVFAVASDDNHYKKSKVGRGWIMVDSQALTKEDIEESVRKGNFYASTGIILKEYLVTEKLILIDTENGTHISFTGKYGKVLKKTDGTNASYQIKGNEAYIRVKITDDANSVAWTQPVIIK
jgi:hypothetical protein